MISIQLPDGSVRRFDGPVTVAEVASSIGPGLAKAAIAGRIGDGAAARLVDTSYRVEGDTKLAIAVKETTMTTAEDTMPASTTDCPMTKPPTIDTALPAALGIRSTASRNISNTNSIRNASRYVGNGMPSRCAASFSSSWVGIIS